MEIAVYIMIVLLVVNLVVGVCFYVRTKKSDRNALSCLRKELEDARAKNDALRKALDEFYGVMFGAGDLIHGLYDLTSNKEIVGFLCLVGGWIRGFTCGLVGVRHIDERLMIEKRNLATRSLEERHSKEFPSLSMADLNCFLIFTDYWYKGLVKPRAMIDFCSQIACERELKVGEAVWVVAASGDYDDLMQAVKEITGKEGQ